MLRTVAATLIAATCATACLGGQDIDHHCEEADKLFGACQDDTGGWDNGGGGGGSGTYVPRNAELLAPIVPYGVAELYQGIYPVAVGGTSTITIDGHDTLDLKVTLGAGPGRLTATETSQTTSIITTYRVTSMSVPGTTPVTLTSDNFEPISAQIVTKTVHELKLMPEPFTYTLASDTPAFTYWTRRAVLHVLAADGTRLVDGTLVASAPYLGTLAWDHYELPAVEEHGTVTVTADSVGTREVPYDVFNTLDRIEAVVSGTPSPGHSVSVCFHAYHGDREVVAPFEFDTAPFVEPSYAKNCAGVYFTGGNTHSTVTAHSLGLDHSVEVAIPAP